jgi:death-on-curing protein
VTEFLDLDDLLVIAGIARGGPALVRDPGQLASAIARPQTTVFGEDVYPGLLDKAAALMHSLACNHALADGNKRLAWLATYTFLRINGVDLNTGDQQVIDLVIDVADGTLEDVVDIAKPLVPWS